VAEFGYRIHRRHGNTILAVDTRTVGKLGGGLLIALFGLVGVFFLLIAITSKNDAVLGTAIFLVSVTCALVTLFAIRRIVVRSIIFTPEALLVEGDQGRRSFDVSEIACFFSSRHSLKMTYGTASVTVLRRLPSAARIEAQVARLLDEYRSALGAPVVPSGRRAP